MPGWLQLHTGQGTDASAQVRKGSVSSDNPPGGQRSVHNARVNHSAALFTLVGVRRSVTLTA